MNATAVSADDYDLDLVATVEERLHVVRERILAAGGTPDEVTIVAVTKGQGNEAVEAAVAAGIADVGESFAQELERKATAATAAETHPRWHLLGHVQRNKVRRIAGLVHLWQGIDRLAAGEEVARRAPGTGVLVQVNISGEPGKNGCSFDDAPQLVDDLRAAELDVRGLMAVGPAGPPERAREGFRRLARMADRLGLAERSMGMTDDLEVAVQEGSTMVRLGRALFGERPVPRDRRR